MKKPRYPYCETSGKYSYGNRKLAKTALNRRIAEGGNPKSVYKCRYCGDWHLTSREDRAA